MRLFVIAPINSIHTVRWINSLVDLVEKLYVASAHELLETVDERIIFHKLPHRAPYGYFLNHSALKRIIKKVHPDLVHTHFMSGYGTLSALSVDKEQYPHLLSMWGSDIYDFPYKSFLHKTLIRWVADKASALASTSNVMKAQFFKIYPKYERKVWVTPFGVDTNLFSSKKDGNENSTFNVGIAKNIEDKYGIKYLIEGFALFIKNHPNSRLHIIGDGSKVEELKLLTKNLCLENRVVFYGKKKNEELPSYLNTWDVCVVPSILDSESFGVSAVEASSCGIPVVVSNVGGLPEVVEDGITGIVIPAKDASAISRKLDFLFLNKELGKQMGEKGREKVLKEFSWKKNVENMMSIYKNMIINES